MAMVIDPRKVQLAEKDLEDWLWENPKSVFSVDRWVARQYRVPSGIIDLLGIHEFGGPIVVEVKNVPFKSEHLTQVQRYAFDINRAFVLLAADRWEDLRTGKILIGPYPPDSALITEADAMNIHVLTMDITLDAKVSNYWHKSKKMRDEEKYTIAAMVKDQVFAEFLKLEQIQKTMDEARQDEEKLLEWLNKPEEPEDE